MASRVRWLRRGQWKRKGNFLILGTQPYILHQQEATHASFSMAKAAAATWSHLLPDHLAAVAENMQGVHSIE